MARNWRGTGAVGALSEGDELRPRRAVGALSEGDEGRGRALSECDERHRCGRRSPNPTIPWLDPSIPQSLVRYPFRMTRSTTYRIGLGTIVCGLLAGCAPRAEFTLNQPFAPPAQQHLLLASDWAYDAPGGDHQRCLLAFPLAGSKEPPRAYAIYLLVPGEKGTYPVAPGPSGVQGFLIQELGRTLKGRTDFVTGTVAYAPVFLKPREHRVELDVQCQDGSHIVGKAVVEDLAPEVKAFERQYAADVKSLRPTSQPAPADETPTRLRP